MAHTLLNAALGALAVIPVLAIARTGVWDPEQLAKQADVVALVQLVRSHALTNGAGATCAVRYDAKVSAVEKGKLRDTVVRFSMGPDYNSGERFRVYLRRVKAEGEFFQDRAPRSRPSKEVGPEQSTLALLKCPGVIPGWVPLGIERLP